MLPAKSYIGARLIRDKVWNKISKKVIVNAQQQIFDMLDLFEDAANTRMSDGHPLEIEDTILSDSIKMAQDFIDQARSKKRAIQNRAIATMYIPELSRGLLMKMQSHAFPEVLMNQVMSYLSPVYRWDSLRMKYTDEFLTEGLKKKTVSRMKVIFNFLYTEAEYHFAFMKQNDIPELEQAFKKHTHGYHYDRLKHILNDAKSNWSSSNKEKKITTIISLYKSLEKMTAKWVIKKNIYDNACVKLTNILHALVIAIKPKKSVKKVRVITTPIPLSVQVIAPAIEETFEHVEEPAVTNPESTMELITSAYDMIGLVLKEEASESISNFVQKVECEVLTAEIAGCVTMREKAEAIWRFAKRNVHS